MKTYIIIFLIIAVIIIFLTWQNNDIVITKYEYINSKVPKKFNGLKIIHISDLHNKDFHGRLATKIKEINPDIIVITGDLIDRRKTKINIATNFIKEIVKIAPTYYVSGNHEQLSEHYEELKNILYNLDVEIMDNSYITFINEGFEIGLAGVADPAINKDVKTYNINKNANYMRNNIKKIIENNVEFNILLSHRPELFDVYRELGINLVFSGHAHGGQIRIPFLGGLLSPNQGFFPKYSEGMNTEGTTSMVVSRGLGNSLFPFRVFNRPELVVVTLKSK